MLGIVILPAFFRVCLALTMNFLRAARPVLIPIQLDLRCALLARLAKHSITPGTFCRRLSLCHGNVNV